MKLIALNTWGGRTFEPFIAWIKEQSSDTDVFCFQEMFTSSADLEISNGSHVHILEDLKKLLPDYEAIFAPTEDGFDTEGPVDFNLTTGPATFVKKSVKIVSSEIIFTHGERNSTKAEDYTTMPSNMLYTQLQTGKGQYHVCNFHGLPYPGEKLDTPKRLSQSEALVKFLATKEGKKILCGDFNLLPGTKSITMIEQAGMMNLISEFAIARTRSNLSKYYGTPEEQRYADFTFVSPEVKVLDFQVPEIMISDHLPMILRFE